MRVSAVQEGRWWRSQPEPVSSPLLQQDRSALNGSWTKASHPALSTHPTGSPPDARLESASARFRLKTAALRLLPTFPTSTSSSTLILDSPLRTRGLSRSSSPSPPLSSKVGSRCSVPSPILVPNVDRSFAAAHQHHRTTPTFQPVHQRSRTRADFRDHPAGARRCRAGSGPAIRRRRIPCVSDMPFGRGAMIDRGNPLQTFTLFGMALPGERLTWLGKRRCQGVARKTGGVSSVYSTIWSRSCTIARSGPLGYPVAPVKKVSRTSSRVAGFSAVFHQ